MSMTQSALRIMALLEPTLIMPELLERAYGGLEVVNETHRTTAVLKMLSAISLPLVSEVIWRPGQKHLLPLLDLCIPGIDLVRSTYVVIVCVQCSSHTMFRMTLTKLSVLPCSSSVPYSTLRLEIFPCIILVLLCLGIRQGKTSWKLIPRTSISLKVLK